MEIIEIVKKLEIDHNLYSPILGPVMYYGICEFRDKECIKIRYFLDGVEYTELFTSEGKYINTKDSNSKVLWVSDKMMLFVNDNCHDCDWKFLENQLTSNHNNLHITIHVSNSYENFDDPKEFFEMMDGKPLGTVQQRKRLEEIITKNKPVEFWTMSLCLLNEIGQYIYENKIEPTQIDVILYEDYTSHRHIVYNREGYLNNWPIGFLD